RVVDPSDRGTGIRPVDRATTARNAGRRAARMSQFSASGVEGSMMGTVSLALFWHQHQPYYPDDVAGENPMPWVRLHATKDYLGMALHLLEFPEMRCTINLVPSLLVQLLAYTEHNASDRFLDVSRIPADSLSEAD